MYNFCNNDNDSMMSSQEVGVHCAKRLVNTTTYIEHECVIISLRVKPLMLLRKINH